MKNSWKDFVQFTSSERRGIFTLSILAVIFAAYSHFVPNWISNLQIADFEEKYAEALKKARDYNDSIELTKELKSEVNYKEIATDHNASKTNTEYNKNEQQVIQEKTLELNTVTAQELIKRGIVDAELAFRIIKFRDGLGGFYSRAQLNEVFGITENDYQKLNGQIEFNAKSIKKLNINISSKEELQSHSYISPKLAQQIINYREKVKPFGSSNDVLKLYMVDEELHSKLMPYLQL